MAKKSQKQATLQQMGGKGNIKRDPSCMASAKQSASRVDKKMPHC
jgi:hypothetical protein